jgi:hypothetical protein
MVEVVPSLGGNSIEQLPEGDVVTPLLEAEGTANDVQENLEFCAGEIRKLLVEELVGHHRVVGAGIAPESNGVRCGVAICWIHKKDLRQLRRLPEVC